MFKEFLSLAILVVSIHGECPKMDEIPVMYNSNAFSCFKYWGGIGGQYDVNSCNGDSWLLPDDYDLLDSNAGVSKIQSTVSLMMDMRYACVIGHYIQCSSRNLGDSAM